LLFQNSPLIGYSLGGIAPAIAQLHGVTDLDFESVKEFEGNSIFVEVLAASGIFGFIPFFLFVWSIVWKPLALSKKLLSEQSKILVALSLSLIFEFVILQFNQVILRPYLWMHIAVLAACYSVFKLSGKFINFEKIE
jgi:O-antigen ligase